MAGTNRSTSVEEEAEKILDSKYESLDYDICESHLFLDAELRRNNKELVKQNFFRWVVAFFIGVFTALVACSVDIAIEQVTNVKFMLITKVFKSSLATNDLFVPAIVWFLLNAGLVAVAGILVVYIEPVAGGSGIPQIKCFLNGVKVPRVLTLRALVAKAIGVVSSVAGGLAVGKEGPMIHSGAVVAAGISQGKSTSLRFDLGIFRYFRNDREMRDFVSGGAAAGVAAAFGAPVGGVLFSLEEGASFWNQTLTWRCLFTSMISTYTLNLVLSSYRYHSSELSNAGLFDFGVFKDLSYNLWDIPLFLLMGCIGGLCGALFNWINYKLSVFRMKYIKLRPLKLLEVLLVAGSSAMAAFVLIYLVSDCRPLKFNADGSSAHHQLQMFCNDNEYNAMASLFLQTPEVTVRQLFHEDPYTYSMLTLTVFWVVYFWLATWTYGISVPSGLFIPSLLVGAAWGRLYGQLLTMFVPAVFMPDQSVGKFALLGAAANLGGIMRMTISLTVILTEATGNIAFGLPLMLVLMTAKWVGDLFNEGIFDMHIHLQSVPLLNWDPPPGSFGIKAKDVMNTKVVTFRPTETVGRVMQTLRTTSHSGFPVVTELALSVDDDGHVSADSNANQHRRRLKGFILRSQLVVLLMKKQIHVSSHEMSMQIDLQPYLNAFPYSVHQDSSLPRIFNLFRGIGLRHLVVVDQENNVVGIVTRKDIARFRSYRKMTTIGYETLTISQSRRSANRSQRAFGNFR